MRMKFAKIKMKIWNWFNSFLPRKKIVINRYTIHTFETIRVLDYGPNLFVLLLSIRLGRFIYLFLEFKGLTLIVSPVTKLNKFVILLS